MSIVSQVLRPLLLHWKLIFRLNGSKAGKKSKKMASMTFYRSQFDVEKLESDKSIHHLKFLSNFYMTIIEAKQVQMNSAEKRFLRDRGDMEAYDEWTGNKMKICELYECWLRELSACQVPTFDDVARTMHAMMLSDCFWFLAKIHRPQFDGKTSNYARACETLESIFPTLRDTLHPSNAFYAHVVRKYARLVEDYRKALGEYTLNGSSRHVPAHMTSWDIYKCREASRTCFQHLSILRGVETSETLRDLKKMPYHETHVFRFSRISLNSAN
ncbi:unnamed protein product [Caenorhabditis auriculariae]|uniref:Uncharacterized protein n=1 Tax=Caenorhabditis auriculariae TaxID=2777116 RepID=A0A8S1GZF4_9PELO|nr:unnamed protein product [Caenorhabditis auriculariae]